MADVLPFREKRPSSTEPKLRDVLGEVLRDERLAQDRTLADVATEAAVSLPYLSEIERGRKEVSSDLLAAVSGALGLPLHEVLERAVGRLRLDARAHLRAGARPQRGTHLQLLAA